MVYLVVVAVVIAAVMIGSGIFLLVQPFRVRRERALRSKPPSA